MYNIDYSVLVFFAAMFVFTPTLLTSGLIPAIMSKIPNPVEDHDYGITNNAIILIVRLTLSQILCNVPFVTLYNNVMIYNGFNVDDVSHWMMLASACTIAGNLITLRQFADLNHIHLMQCYQSIISNHSPYLGK